MKGDLGQGAATLRLVAASGRKDGAYVAGVEIRMTPGSHTYWKMPGEAGVPPVFSFNGSKNVAAADVKFPVPERISEDGIDAFGYTGTVVFPVLVKPTDASKPSDLHVDVTYAVCNKICIPAHGVSDLTLPSQGNRADDALVETALVTVPSPLPSAQKAELQIKPMFGQAKPSWTVTWIGKAPVTDIFADAPEGYFFDTRKAGPDSWTLTASQSVTALKATNVPVELTLALTGGGLVTTETLDLARAPK